MPSRPARSASSSCASSEPVLTTWCAWLDGSLLAELPGGCNDDEDSDTAGPDEQPCQAATLENAESYLCPKGFLYLRVVDTHMH